jgi:hypothetical protein
MEHPSGCLCHACGVLARRWAYAYWNLREFDDFAEGLDKQLLWEDLVPGSPELGRRRVVLAGAA